MPSLHQLECFVIYGRVKNFSQAAKEANITQSAFSAQMKKLEEILGIALIHRSNRGSCLTEAGENFLGKAQAYVDGLHEIVYEIQAQAGKAPIELNVAVLRSLGDVHMNRHVSYFQQQNKKICFNIFDMEEDEIRKGLFEGHIDVASVYRFESDAYADFVCTHFSDDEIIFFCSAYFSAIGSCWTGMDGKSAVGLLSAQFFHEQSLSRVFRKKAAAGGSASFHTLCNDAFLSGKPRGSTFAAPLYRGSWHYRGILHPASDDKTGGSAGL